MMSSKIGKINERTIFYLEVTSNVAWSNSLPNDNWILFAIADNEQISHLKGLAKECLDKNVLYVCCAGTAADSIHLAFDLEIVRRKVASNDDNYDDTPITTGHEDLNEGFWFASTAACHGTKE